MNEKMFEMIVDRCVARLAEGETVADCVADYPEIAERLRPLLEVAAHLEEMPMSVVRREAKRAGQARMLAAWHRERQNKGTGKLAVSSVEVDRYTERKPLLKRLEVSKQMNYVMRLAGGLALGFVIVWIVIFGGGPDGAILNGSGGQETSVSATATVGQEVPATGTPILATLVPPLATVTPWNPSATATMTSVPPSTTMTMTPMRPTVTRTPFPPEMTATATLTSLPPPPTWTPALPVPTETAIPATFTPMVPSPTTTTQPLPQPPTWTPTPTMEPLPPITPTPTMEPLPPPATATSTP
ncbi:MAG TPA: hypothetical protein VLL52_15190 [Anaerolineae bacterium]|nr:hypothetical protein [Anaerolineae bacterium]